MIHVKWGRDVLHFPIPPPETPLGQLRADLAAYTHLAPGSFKLVYKGGVMKDDGAPLSAYKIKENATIALIGGGAPVVVSDASPNQSPNEHEHERAPDGHAAPASQGTQHKHKKQQTQSQTEESAIAAIQAELDRVRETLVPDVDAFVRALALAPPPVPGSEKEMLTTTTTLPSPPKATPPPSPPPASQTPTPLDHTRLSELLLQSLLRLDALHVPGADWPEARVQRKAAVREVQGVLERLDGAWAAR